MRIRSIALLSLALLISLNNLALAEDTAVDDFVAAMKIAGSQFTRPVIALEASRTVVDGRATGLSVNVLERNGNVVSAQNFICPYARENSVLVEACNSQPERPAPSGNMASILSAIDELAESATAARLNPATIHFVKAWNVGNRIFLRASFSPPLNGASNAVFSCHVAGHGNEAPHMHCHFNSTNPVGPNEPIVSARR
jgi:hypothetical protein